GLSNQPRVKSTSLSHVASPRGVRRSFDVYLSFRMLHNEYFGVNLVDALVSAGLGISPFFSLPTLEVKASIIILSGTYASTSLCLDELPLILEQRRKSNLFVLPVFYNLEPSDIINDVRGFLLQKINVSEESKEKVDQWHAALTEIANLTGVIFSGNNNDDTTVIEEIVSIVRNELYPSPVQDSSKYYRGKFKWDYELSRF
ncbi:TMV resistance protein N-like protein, partial [Tanacetum coccineum]